MKLLLPGILSFLYAAGIAHASSVTATTCAIGTASVSNPSSCTLNAPNSTPSATASVAIGQLTAISNQGLNGVFSIGVTGSSNAVPLIASDPNSTVNTSATAMANINQMLVSAGPIRPGLLTFSSGLNITAGTGNNPYGVTVSVGSLQGSCSGGVAVLCMGGPLLGGSGSHSSAFTLGTPFSLSFTESFSAFGDYNDGTGFSSGNVNFNFQLFEANGVTPVTLFAAPEPGTFGLSALCFFGLGLIAFTRSVRF